MGISYVTGDATDPQTTDMVVIPHVCNDVGKFGAGFAAAIAARYPTARERYLEWFRGGTPKFGLGRVQWVGVGRDWSRTAAWSDRWVVNMVAQHGVRDQEHPKPLWIDALEACLEEVGSGVSTMYQSPVSVHMPRIGCGLAGGTWDEVEPLIDRQLCARGVTVVVYDPPGQEGA